MYINIYQLYACAMYTCIQYTGYTCLTAMDKNHRERDRIAAIKAAKEELSELLAKPAKTILIS